MLIAAVQISIDPPSATSAATATGSPSVAVSFVPRSTAGNDIATLEAKPNANSPASSRGSFQPGTKQTISATRLIPTTQAAARIFSDFTR